MEVSVNVLWQTTLVVQVEDRYWEEFYINQGLKRPWVCVASHPFCSTLLGWFCKKIAKGWQLYIKQQRREDSDNDGQMISFGYLTKLQLPTQADANPWLSRRRLNVLHTSPYYVQQVEQWDESKVVWAVN